MCAGRTFAALERLFDRVGDRLHLPRALPRTQHEKVGECGRVAEVEQDDVRGFFIESGAHRAADVPGESLLAACNRPPFFSFCHASDLP